MAEDMVIVMDKLGFSSFAITGHDRGGRVAYRAALDHPDRIDNLAVLDVLPIDAVWGRANTEMALAFWPWSLLSQPEPLPERLLASAPDVVIDHCLSSNWGTPADTFDETVRAAYVAALSDREHVHAICEEYRAAATIDPEHDAADRQAGRRMSCPVLALWSGSAPLGSWYTAIPAPSPTRDEPMSTGCAITSAAARARVAALSLSGHEINFPRRGGGATLGRLAAAAVDLRCRAGVSRSAPVARRRTVAISPSRSGHGP